MYISDFKSKMIARREEEAPEAYIEYVEDADDEANADSAFEFGVGNGERDITVIGSRRNRSGYRAEIARPDLSVFYSGKK